MTHGGTVPLETPRLLLRRFTPEDAPAMYSGWATDPEVARWMRWDPHKNEDETREIVDGWVESYARNDSYLWAITLKEDGRLIGSIGVILTAEDQPCVPTGHWQPGYNIARPYWGKGYTTEALIAVVDYFERTTGVAVMYCCHAKGNPASGRVMEKAGFVRQGEGVYHKPDGTEVPAYHYKKICGSVNE